MAVIMVPLLLCALVVCGVIFITTNSPDTPVDDDFRPSLSEAQAFDNEIARATNMAAQQGVFYFNFTERQLSSWLALEGANFADDYGYDFPFDDVQVGIDNGQFTFYADVEQAGITLPLEVVIEPDIDSAGQLDLTIDSASVAGVVVPNFLVDSVTDQIKDKMLQAIEDLPGSYALFRDSLTADDGVFIVQGRIDR